MSALSIELSARVAKLLPRLGSDQQGEVAAVAAAISRTLKAAGHDLHDLAEHITEGAQAVVVYRERPAEPRHPENWRAAYGASGSRAQDQDRVARCQRAEGLSPWEMSFLASIAQQLATGRTLSAKQRSTLDGIAAKVEARA